MENEDGNLTSFRPLLHKHPRSSSYWSELHVAVKSVIVVSTVVFLLVTSFMVYVALYAKHTNRKERKHNSIAIEQEEAVIEARRRKHLSNYTPTGGDKPKVISVTVSECSECSNVANPKVDSNKNTKSEEN